MKKILSLALVLVLALSVFVGCGNSEKDYTLATSIVVTETLGSSKLALTAASIVTDADGKIVDCRLDCVEYSAYDKQGNLVETAPVSKVAQGAAYDSYAPMPAGSWFKQAEALENYVVGKTQSEVAATALEGGKAADAELKASCSIGITDLLKAIDNAFKSEHKVSFKSTATEFTAGLSVVGSVKITENDTSVDVKYSATFSTAILAEGKVVAAIVDTAEPTLKGVIADEGAASLDYKGSKREQGDAYDSYAPMAGGRWYAQADAYAASAVGKTASDIATLATEGVAGCTIAVADYKAGIEAAVKSAK